MLALAINAPLFYTPVAANVRTLSATRKVTIMVGADTGALPHVRTFDGQANQPTRDWLAYNLAFRGGVRVAAGDVSGDGVPDLITGAGAGAGPEVKVFDGVSRTVISDSLVFAPTFRGGVYVAAGDVDGDGRADIITGAGAGGAPQVRVFSGKTGVPLKSFLAFDAAFTGGVQVAAGDVNGDAKADIITGAGPGGGPQVRVFDAVTGSDLANFFAYAVGFHGGVFVAAGDINGDEKADIITGAGAGGGPQVKVFEGTTQSSLANFFAYEPTFSGGVRVAAADLDGDGTDEIVTAPGAGRATQVKGFGPTGATLLDFVAFPLAAGLQSQLSASEPPVDGIFVSAANRSIAVAAVYLPISAR
jgi:hypothetical protein